VKRERTEAASGLRSRRRIRFQQNQLRRWLEQLRVEAKAAERAVVAAEACVPRLLFRAAKTKASNHTRTFSSSSRTLTKSQSCVGTRCRRQYQKQSVFIHLLRLLLRRIQHVPYQGGRDVVMLPAATSAPNWTWQDCERPWLVTRWRVSLINELGEIYAIEIGNRSGISGWTEPDEPDRPGRGFKA
jgi:hypothetical protein